MNQFNDTHMIQAFLAGRSDDYICVANGEDKLCHCKRGTDCTHRKYVTPEEWLEKYKERCKLDKERAEKRNGIYSPCKFGCKNPPY